MLLELAALRVFDQDMVQRTGAAVASPAETHRESHESLKLKTDVLGNMRQKRPAPKSLDETAWMSKATLVLIEAR
jgi:hypothetical protein